MKVVHINKVKVKAQKETNELAIYLQEKWKAQSLRRVEKMRKANSQK